MKKYFALLTVLAFFMTPTVALHAEAALPSGSPQETAPASPSTPSGGQADGRRGVEHHPEIHRAMHALQNAKDALERAAHDYDGHRAKALDHIDAALAELEEALAIDRQ